MALEPIGREFLPAAAFLQDPSWSQLHSVCCPLVDRTSRPESPRSPAVEISETHLIGSL